MRAALGVLADVLCVLAFVVIGRASHQAGESLAGVTSTAWPFLAGLAAGEAAPRAWRRPAALVPTGVGVWLATVALGQLLRVVSGPGTDAAFIAVFSRRPRHPFHGHGWWPACTRPSSRARWAGTAMALAADDAAREPAVARRLGWRGLRSRGRRCHRRRRARRSRARDHGQLSGVGELDQIQRARP